MRETDLADELMNALPSRLAQWAPQIAKAAIATVPGSVELGQWARILAAVMDRESNGGNALAPKGPAGTGDYGHGRGLMQIDDRTWTDFTSGDGWKDPEANIRFGAELLADNWDRALGPPQALAAYNAGPRALAAENPDRFTTKGNYSSDVLARAERFA